MKTLGIDLGGTKIAAAIVDDGTILSKHQVETPKAGQDAVFDAMADAARILLYDHPEIQAVGIGSPGPIDFDKGEIIFAPNIHGMTNAPIVRGLEKRLNLPVSLENDANAAGYAEHLYGAAQDVQSSIYITISTGIGGGIFLGDHIWRGAHGLAGEIGHMTLQSDGEVGGDGHFGGWEAMAAGRAIARDGSYVFNSLMSTKDIFAKAKDGDRHALKIIDRAARYTGIGIANLFKAFDPHAFIIGGGMIHTGAFYFDKVHAWLADYVEGYPQPTLRFAKLGVDAGVIGAAAVAAKNYHT
jgi:glucokinase